MTKKIKILLADDILIAREGWKYILETDDLVEVVGECDAAYKIFAKIQETNPDILLMNLKWFGDVSAGTTVREIKKSFTNVRIIAITAYENLISDARLAGADVVLLKTFTREKLLTIIRELAPREINT